MSREELFERERESDFEWQSLNVGALECDAAIEAYGESR
jgi:hypothetical protein